MTENAIENSFMKVSPGLLSGRVSVPLSKSILHRALICAMLAGDISLADIGSDTLSDDICATMECLQKLIARKSSQDATANPDAPLHLSCKESGSTLRFLVPLAASLGIPVILDGSGRLPNRPLAEFTAIFEGKGVSLSFPKDGKFLPLCVQGQLHGGVFHVPGNIRSQYITGLLLSLPTLPHDSEIILTSPLESEPYVEMTRDVMHAFCVATEKTKTGYLIPGRQTYSRKTPYRGEPDFSQAAFWLVGEYLGSHISVLPLPNESFQGDSAIVSLLKDLRAYADRPVSAEPPFQVDASQIPDLVPIFSVAAAATPCVTQIIRASRLRFKECDRLMATQKILSALGVQIDETEDGLIIYGKENQVDKPIFTSCNIYPFHDHRMVMAAAIAATRADGPVNISDYRAADKSYPEFFRDFRTMGGHADELHVGK